MRQHLGKVIIIFVAAAVILSGCSSSAMGATSWPGLSSEEGIAYLASASGVYAVDAQSGLLKWRYPDKANARIQFFAEPAVMDGLVIVGDFTHTLYALNKDTGLEVWKFEAAKGRWIGSPLFSGDTLYAPNADRSLYALDNQGKLKWTFKTDEPIWSQPASSNGTIFQPSMDHYLYAIEAVSGKQIWATDCGGAINSSPAYHADGKVIIGTLAGELLALDEANGTIAWRTALKGSVWSKPVIKENTAYVGDYSGTIHAVEITTGEILWQVDTGGIITGSGALTPDGLIFNDEDGKVVMVNFDGVPQWEDKLEAKLYGTPNYTGDVIIVPLSQSKELLVAYNLSGVKKWTFSLPE